MTPGSLSEHLFNAGVDIARAHVEQLHGRAPCVVVTGTAITPDGVSVACGEHSYPRCVADVFEGANLTITAIDNGDVAKEYIPGEWVSATQYGLNGDVEYRLTPGMERR